MWVGVAKFINWRYNINPNTATVVVHAHRAVQIIISVVYHPVLVHNTLPLGILKRNTLHSHIHARSSIPFHG
jgi:hypothetical protein